MTNESYAESSHPENQQKWSQLVKRAQNDEQLQERLLSDPAPVLRNEGIEIPDGAEARVLKEGGHLRCVFESRPASAELNAEELSSVTGGGAKAASSKTQTQSGSGKQQYLTYTMTEVFISS
jgi:hypothetical protein